VIRRIFGAVLAATVALLVGGGAAAGIHRGHAIAMHGTPKYGPDFEHFAYVDPNAPKGGTLRLGVAGTFDSFNPYIIRGNPAAGVGAETLTTASADEPFTQYGLIAESIEWPDDRAWVVFTLRPEARWHDGRPITVDDVVFSFETLKAQGAPFYRFYYGSVERAEEVGERRVKFVFSESRNQELPLIIGQMPILPKHYWQERDFQRGTPEPPLTSGPYRVAAYELGRYVLVERVADYWGAHLPVNVGQNNFERMRFDYFRDDTVIRQALKAGALDFRQENQAKAWALDYDVPAVREGWLVREEVPHERPAGMQAFVFNTRRPIFQDRRIRRALAYAFDFEWTNRILFFGQYTRTTSYFANSELASHGLPEGGERELLERYRGRITEAVFDEEYRVPTTDGSGWPRDNLVHALDLLNQAGWEVRDMQLVERTGGAPMRFEILLVNQAFERVVLPFVRNLAKLGIDARVRLVDQSQYINRLREFDFDMIVGGWGQSDSPGNEQRSFWGSKAAATPGSRNYAGVSDPVVDELVELVISAPDREALIERTRALDRVLLWGDYVIPNWHTRVDRILWWNKFSRPAVTPKDGTSTEFWWYDEVKAARLDQRRIETADADAEPADGGSALRTVAIATVLGTLAFLVLRRFRTGRSG
jgi:microcin C transport system substrate-binding protein